MRIPLWLILAVVVGLGAVIGGAVLAVLRRLGMKEPDHVGQMGAGERCEMCEQTTVERQPDGSVSCFGCGHVRAAGVS